MTLHWWMHWFWVTISAVSALLFLSTTIAALPLGPYALSTQSIVGEQPDIPDDSTVTDWSLHVSDEPLHAEHYIPDSFSTDLWTGTQDLYRTSTASSTVLLPVVDVPDVTGKEMEDSPLTAITEPNISAYLLSGTEQVLLSGSATPFVFHVSSSSNSSQPNESHVHVFSSVTEGHVFLPLSSVDSSQFIGKQSIMSDDDDDEKVPVTKSALLPESGNENKSSYGIEGTAVSINGESNYATVDDNSSVLITTKDLSNITQSVFNNSESLLSDTVNISVDPMIDNLNSFSHSINKALVNIPHIVTRDVRNSSELSINTSSPISIVTSHGFDQDAPDHTSLASSPLTQLKPLTSRSGKSADYLPPQQHPLVLSTVSPSKDGPDVFPLPHRTDKSDVMQGYKRGPKSSDDFLSSSHVEAIVTDSKVPEDDKSDSRVIWISKTTPVSDIITPEHRKKVSKVESKPDSFGLSQAEDIEMADGPYNPPESSTSTGSKPGAAGDGVSKPPSTTSHEFGVPANRTVDGSDAIPSDSHHFSSGPNVTVEDKGRDKVDPQLTNSSKIMNTSSHSVLQSDNRIKISHAAPTASEIVNGNTSVGSSTDVASSSATIGEAGSLADARSSVMVLPTTAPSLKQVGNVTTPKVIEENQTNIVTVLPTTVPVSNGRVAAGAGSHHDLDAASITGISLGILVFAGLIGAVSFVLYRRRFLNKPQTLNDKCSNPDSSGYIDDSTLRENSEEMYSLDNDSFLNSLEAMTIQNYWTDNVKHTKL